MNDKTEAVVLCLDNSEYMRNEDYCPNRWTAQTHGVSWIFNSMGTSHAFGLIAMAGKRANILSPVVADISVLHSSLDHAHIGGDCNVKDALHMAQMVLRNRPPRCTSARVILFAGSPVRDTVESLSDLAKLYKKNGTALDVISFGDSPADMLQNIVNMADRNGNCHFVQCSPEDSMTVCLMDLLPDDVGILPHTSINASRGHGHHMESDPPPLLRMPPPNRVCRRVVVDHTKYAAQKAAASSPLPSTLSLSLTLSLSSPRTEASSNGNNSNNNNNNNNNNNTRPNTNEKDSRLVLLVPLPSQRNKKIVVEFQAGRCQMSGSQVRPVRRKGQLALLLINDDILQFVWRDRQTGSIEMDLLVHSQEAKFTRVPAHITSSRVYCLHLVDSNKRQFFWMQHNNIAKDDEYCDIINYYLTRVYPPSPSHPGASSLHSPHLSSSHYPPQHPASRAQYHTLNASDLQQLLALYSLPLSFPSARSGRSSSSSSSSSSSGSSSSSSSHGLSLRGRATKWSSSSQQAGEAADGGGFRGRWIKNPLWTQNVRPRSVTTGGRSVVVEEETAVRQAVRSSKPQPVPTVGIADESLTSPSSSPPGPSVMLTPPAAAILAAAATTPLIPAVGAAGITTASAKSLPLPTSSIIPAESTTSTPTATAATADVVVGSSENVDSSEPKEER